jgi:hypothetical protein
MLHTSSHCSLLGWGEGEHVNAEVSMIYMVIILSSELGLKCCFLCVLHLFYFFHLFVEQ